MSGEQNHPYHLVDPSPLPIISSFSAFAMAIGAALFMHDHAGGEYILILGFLGVLACMYSWWKNVIREGIHDKAHNPVVQHGLRFGMVLFIVSEVMFFSAFFWAFFNSSIFPKLPLEDTWEILAGVWPPEGIPYI